MSRFIQEQNRPAPKEKPIRELPKAGKYTSKELEGAKKIVTPNGGKR